MEERGKGFEHSLIGAFRFIPILGRTYLLLLLSPRRYFENLESPHLVNAASPAAFWLTNVLLVKILRSSTEAPDPALITASASGILGLCLGTALFALWMVAGLDLRGWSSFRLMLRVVFAGALLFLPFYAAAAYAEPMSTELMERLTSAILLGALRGVAWHEWARVLLLPAVFLAWLLMVAFGIRVVFGKSKASIAVVLFAWGACVVTVVLLWTGVQLSTMVRRHVAGPERLWNEARAALALEPPDYLAAGRAFDALVAFQPSAVSRDRRLVARIGSAAAGRATLAVLLKRPEVERKLNDSLVRLLSGQTAEAVTLLEQASREFSGDPGVRAVLGEDQMDDIAEIKSMLADELHDPVLEAPESRGRRWLAELTPSLFP